ncbi:hypothetical protein pqer_cds_495 [Pandoravirus quercus]|uniref:Uncharacterized protein n=2 Tax=Pandoravirus TaxID=2060084 RepID=A0A2U7U8Z8_9VIRU|nr:hypothetical protein pqer_cds_495 [Pandoravirus quercus]AVK74917.1 hypothetical protein pqer_cds_495 [Pandoravirus quercus]QBZ81103.1 hypothetical protein pclt_cds_509 [Pandoravirus celtis]
MSSYGTGGHVYDGGSNSAEPTLVDRLSGADRVRVPGIDALRALAAHPMVRASGAPAIMAVAVECVAAAYTYLLVRPVAHIYHNAPGTENWGMWFGAPPADMCARMTGAASTAADWAANPAGCHAMIQRRFNGFLTMVHTALALLVAVRVWRAVRDALSAALRGVGRIARWAVGMTATKPHSPPCCRSCRRPCDKAQRNVDL